MQNKRHRAAVYHIFQQSGKWAEPCTKVGPLLKGLTQLSSYSHFANRLKLNVEVRGMMMLVRILLTFWNLLVLVRITADLNGKNGISTAHLCQPQILDLDVNKSGLYRYRCQNDNQVVE